MMDTITVHEKRRYVLLLIMFLIDASIIATKNVKKQSRYIFQVLADRVLRIISPSSKKIRFKIKLKF